ncbi:MAG: WYL domain-containing protein [Candidatus Marinimicrobia bacterium]|nr:WYL domain-containing protein [Candidatus Neomarinimicrobiota bacterium]MBL7022606.1 WYL domain-containing protein [Candidatus Neomarinimicrobiota bacterium]
MSEFSQIQRLVRILQILTSRKNVTTKELVERFNYSVSKRTIQRDMLALSENGVPLVSEKIKANENIWYIMDHFKQFIPVPLNTNEVLAMQMLKTNLYIFKNTKIESDVEKLIKKIDQIIPEEVFLELENVTSENLFENYSKAQYEYSCHNKTITDLILAITEKRICKVLYHNQSKDEHKRFTFEPVKLITYNGGLYIIVFIRKYKSFIFLAIHRIEKLEIMDKNFADDHNFDEKRFMKNRFGLYSGKPVEIKLKFDKSIAHYIEGRNWHHTQEIGCYKSGDLWITLLTGITPELIAWIMSWHKNVKVIKPKSLVKEINSIICDIQKLY